MKRLSQISILWVLLAMSGYAQKMDMDYLEQIKRQARTNNHVKKKLKGEVVSLLFHEITTTLYGFVFSSNGSFYEVAIPKHQGEELYPLLKTGVVTEIEVTADPTLFEKHLFVSNHILRVENKLGIRVSGLVNLQRLTSKLGFFERKRISMQQFENAYSEYEEQVRVISKKRGPFNQWSLAMENGDTLLLKMDNGDADIQPDDRITYLKSKSPLATGSFVKNSNSYNLFAQPSMSNGKDQNPFVSSKSALLIQKSNLKALDFLVRDDGLMEGIKVLKGKDTLKLFFDTKSGSKVENEISMNQDFEAFLRVDKNNRGLLYGFSSPKGSQFLAHEISFIGLKNHYYDGEKTFTGKITRFNQPEKEVKNSLKGFVLNDSIYVKVNEIVAININGELQLGKPVEIKGSLRKNVEGEVSMKHYQIFSPSEIRIDGKLFKQQIHDINTQF